MGVAQCADGRAITLSRCLVDDVNGWKGRGFVLSVHAVLNAGLFPASSRSPRSRGTYFRVDYCHIGWPSLPLKTRTVGFRRWENLLHHGRRPRTPKKPPRRQRRALAGCRKRGVAHRCGTGRPRCVCEWRCRPVGLDGVDACRRGRSHGHCERTRLHAQRRC